MNPMCFLRKWFFGRSGKNHEVFTRTTRAYILKGEEDVRCAAVAAAGLATRKGRKTMARELENIAANFLQSCPGKSQKKVLAERILSLKETVESSVAKRGKDGEEKKRLSILNTEYFPCLREGDPSVFCRRGPKLFCRQHE